MPVSKKQSKKGLPKRAGQHGDDYKRYFHTVAEARKVRHIFKRNGRAAAEQYAAAHGVTAAYLALLK
jgi:hypothetical protein